jgi:hypothetical protein
MGKRVIFIRSHEYQMKTVKEQEQSRRSSPGDAHILIRHGDAMKLEARKIGGALRSFPICDGIASVASIPPMGEGWGLTRTNSSSEPLKRGYMLLLFYLAHVLVFSGETLRICEECLKLFECL